MKICISAFCLIIGTLLVTASGSFALPTCPGSPSREVGDTQKIAQFTVSEIIGFLNEFETPPWVFERMFQQSEMYYFKESELVQLETEVSDVQKATYEKTEKFISELRTALEEIKD